MPKPKPRKAHVDIKRIPGGFKIIWAACPTCGEPPFGGTHYCNCSKETHNDED